MNVEEIRTLLGGYGSRQYSDEVCRTNIGIAWYDGKFRLGNADNDQAVFFNWKNMSQNEGVAIIAKYR